MVRQFKQARTSARTDEEYGRSISVAREALREYTEHYHLERNHQGLDNKLIEKPSRPVNMGSAVDCRERLGGILKYYHRRAA